MPIVSIPKLKKHFEVPLGAKLMEVLLEHQAPVASSCGGDGVCAKCGIIVLEGMENLSVETEHESFLRQKNQIPIQKRISCQVFIYGDIVVDATYW